MSWFKTKEEKREELELKLSSMRIVHYDAIDTYCKINDYIFILKGFEMKDDEIIIQYIDKDTNEGKVDEITINEWEKRFKKSDFRKNRYEFIKFRDDLNKIGLKIKRR
jgi:hypothetical protein